VLKSIAQPSSSIGEGVVVSGTVDISLSVAIVVQVVGDIVANVRKSERSERSERSEKKIKVFDVFGRVYRPSGSING
jgi:NH3-dependent NAD+ synthetase